MGHTVGGGVYQRLQQRLDQHVTGAPDSPNATVTHMPLTRTEER